VKGSLSCWQGGIVCCIGLVATLGACATIDQGSFGPFQRSLNVKSYGYSIAEDQTKTSSVNLIEIFEVRPGDCASEGGWSDCANDRERSELSEQNKSTCPGDEYWYGWYIYFQDDYRNIYPTKVALGQFHQDKSHPIWMFQNADGGYHLDDQVMGHTRKYYKLIDETELRGKWHRIEVCVRWAKDETGFFRVWVNGEQKVDYTGKTMDAEKVYFKYGLYRSFLSRYKNQYQTDVVPVQKVYFANVKRAKSREGLAPR
jgi:hypothetical protein